MYVAAMVSKLDESVGRVVQALNEQKMLHNTIIVFMSDNGSPSFDDSGRNFGSAAGVTPNWGSNFPYRGVSVYNILAMYNCPPAMHAFYCFVLPVLR